MSGGENLNWGKKGACLGKFLVALILLVCLLIYVYNHGANQIG